MTPLAPGNEVVRAALSEALPAMTGLSARNPEYMRAFEAAPQRFQQFPDGVRSCFLIPTTVSKRKT